VAASTRGSTIRLQPLPELRKKSIVESTLRHELLHVLIESRARTETPLWFREGLVLYLSAPDQAEPAPAVITDQQMEAILGQPHNREEMGQAYAAARARVAALVRENGKPVVLGWLSAGIPGSVLSQSAAPPEHGADQHP
jgi:stage II sporulation protein D